MESFTSADGTSIAYRQWGSDYGGVPVVLHHGFATDSLRDWVTSGVADRIVAGGRCAVALDARGHGRSDKPADPGAYGSGQMAADVSRLIDHLDAPQIDLIGYGLGARVALEVAINEPRVRSLVVAGLGAAALDPRPTDAGADMSRAPTPDAVAASSSPWLRPDASATDDAEDADGADGAARAALVSVMGAGIAGVGRISIPTLVLVGADDELAAGADEVATAIPGAQLVVVPGDHVHALGRPEFADAIVAFLRVQVRRGRDGA